MAPKYYILSNLYGPSGILLAPDSDDEESYHKSRQSFSEFYKACEVAEHLSNKYPNAYVDITRN